MPRHTPAPHDLLYSCDFFSSDILRRSLFCHSDPSVDGQSTQRSTGGFPGLPNPWANGQLVTGSNGLQPNDIMEFDFVALLFDAIVGIWKVTGRHKHHDLILYAGATGQVDHAGTFLIVLRPSS
jgi:hypothetical protein